MVRIIKMKFRDIKIKLTKFLYLKTILFVQNLNKKVQNFNTKVYIGKMEESRMTGVEERAIIDKRPKYKDGR